MKTSRFLAWTTMPHRSLTILLLVGLLLSPALPPAMPAAAGVDQAGISSAQHAAPPTVLLPRAVATADEIALDNAVALSPGASADWWATVWEDIRQSEYHVTWQERTYLADLPAAYQAPNRAHNLRAYFTPDGIRVIPRAFEGQTSPWEWGLALTGYGYAGAVQPVAAATLHSQANRIEYRRGGLTEWYTNDERGLEQGLTLHAPPDSAQGGKGSLVLELALSGDMTPHLTDDGSVVEFATCGLRCGELAVYDALDRPLPARLELTPHAIRIAFDAAAARYPVTVGSTITGLSPTPAWTAEGDQEGAEFGYAVGTAGDVNGDGYSDVIVGAPYYDNGQAYEGRAFVYHGGVAGLGVSPAWTAEGDQYRAFFGDSVGTAGDVNGDGYSDVVVGAVWYDNGEHNEGRAYVYHGGAGGLSSSPAWTAEGDQAYARFGGSVGTAGDVNGDGYSDVIVGASEYDNGETDEGRAFVYHGGAAGLGVSPAWTAEGNQHYAYFGDSVGTAGDVNGDGYGDVIVGAPYYDDGQTNEGRAYVYHGGTGGLGATPAWTAESNQIGAYFAVSVGTAGDVNLDGYSDVIVGAPEYDNGQTNEGRAFVYHGGADGLSTSPDWTAESDKAHAYFGASVGTAGNVDPTVFSDVIVGAPYYDSGGGSAGRVYVYVGGNSGLTSDPFWAVESIQQGAYFGGSVGTAGDVNGDGYSEVIVGAHHYDNGETDEGRAYVYYGGWAGLSTSPAWTTESNQEGAHFGMSVATAGDVNGDGYSEVIVGAPYYDRGQSEEGRAFVYYGNGARGLPLLPRQLRSDGSVPIARLGMSDDTSAFRLGLTRSMPLGRADVKLQWQVAPLGVRFGETGTIRGSSADWIDTGTAGAQISQLVGGLTPGTAYHWRVRLLYRPGNALGQAASRWVHIPWAGWDETDLRTARRWEVYLPLVLRNH